MKFLILLLSFWLSTADAAVIEGCKMTVGGFCFSATDVRNLIILNTFDMGSGTYSTLRAPNTSTGYQVTGTPLTCYAWKMQIPDAGVAGSFTLMYADTSVNNAGAPGTTPIYYNGSNTFRFGSAAAVAAASSLMPEMAFKWIIPVGKYPTAYAPGTGPWVTFYCLY